LISVLRNILQFAAILLKEIYNTKLSAIDVMLVKNKQSAKLI